MAKQNRQHSDRNPRRFGGRPERGRYQAADGPALLYGWHSVKAALENPARRVRKLMATENALRRLREESIPLPVEPELVRPDAIAARLGETWSNSLDGNGRRVRFLGTTKLF